MLLNDRDVAFDFICTLDNVVVLVNTLGQFVNLVLNECACLALRYEADNERNSTRYERGYDERE